MPGPLVSIIVPVYNGEPFLAQALDSALSQDYEPFELVVVDDGSTDRSAEIAGSYPGVRLLRQENRGVADARNAGVVASSGRLLAFLDQDDVWLEHKLTRQVARLEEDPEAGFALTRMEMFLEPGTPEPDWLPEERRRRDTRGIVPSAMVVRRETFEEVGPFDPRYTMACDSDWLARARDLGIRWTVADEVLVRYRIHGGNEIYNRPTMLHELFVALHASARRRRVAGGMGSE